MPVCTNQFQRFDFNDLQEICGPFPECAAELIQEAQSSQIYSLALKTMENFGTSIGISVLTNLNKNEFKEFCDLTIFLQN